MMRTSWALAVLLLFFAAPSACFQDSGGEVVDRPNAVARTIAHTNGSRLIATTPSTLLPVGLLQCASVSCPSYSQQPLHTKTAMVLMQSDYAVVDDATNTLYVVGLSTATYVPIIHSVNLQTGNASQRISTYLPAPAMLLVFANSSVYGFSQGGTSMTSVSNALNPRNTFNHSVILAGAALSDTSLGVITKLGSNVYLQVFAVNTNNHTLTSASVVPLALSASSGLGTFCMAVYEEQVFSLFSGSDLQATLIGWNATTGELISQTILPFGASDKSRCEQIGSTLLIWQRDVPGALVALVSLAEGNASLAAPVILPPFAYVYTAASVGADFVVSSCSWPYDSVQAQTSDCALTTVSLDGTRNDVYLTYRSFAFAAASAGQNETWLISDLISVDSAIVDLVKVDANFNLVKSFTVNMPLPVAILGARFAYPLISAVLTFNNNGTLCVLQLDADTLAYSYTIVQPSGAFPLTYSVTPAFAFDDEAFYIAAFDQGLGVLRAPWADLTNTTELLLPNFGSPFIESVYSDQDDNNLYLAARGNLWIVSKATLSLVNFAALDMQASGCALLCAVFNALGQQIIILGARYNGSASDECVVTTSVYDSPSLHRLAVQDTTERVQPTAYMIESAGHHALVPNYYCVVSDGGVYKVASNGSLEARYQVGGSFSAAPFSASATRGDTLYVMQSSVTWSAYLDCGEGRFRTNGACAPCPPGSVNSMQDTSACVPCPPNMEADPARMTCVCAAGYFAAAPSQACALCPVGGVCGGQNAIAASDGYWLSPSGAPALYTCPLTDACVNDSCATGFQGVVCAVCTPGYGMWNNRCKHCPDRRETIAFWVLFGLLYTAFFVALLLFGGRWNATMPTVKAVVSVYQILISVPSYPLPGSIARPFTALLDGAQLVLFDLVPVLSVDCLVGRHVPVPLMTIIYGTAPLVVVIMIAGIFWIVSKRTATRLAARKADPFYEQSALDAQVAQYERTGGVFRISAFLLLLVYPTLTAALVRFFVCRSVDGQLFLTEDYTISCSGDAWYSLLPGIVVLAALYPLLAPIGVYVLLRMRRKQWDLTFLHGAYKDEYYWWDSLELTRKLLLFVQTAVWNGGEPTIALAISVCAMALQLQVQPFKEPFDQHVQTLGLLGVILFYLWLSASSGGVRAALAYATFIFVLFYSLVGLAKVAWAIGRAVRARCAKRPGANSAAEEEQRLIVNRALPSART